MVAGDLCAAKFVEDNMWYRAKVEKVGGGKAQLLYVDYGNRDEVPLTLCGQLPSSFAVDKYYAHEYGLACVKLPSDVSLHFIILPSHFYSKFQLKQFSHLTLCTLNLNCNFLNCKI